MISVLCIEKNEILLDQMFEIVNSSIENQKVLKSPIVRNGKEATVGYCPDIWAKWE